MNIKISSLQGDTVFLLPALTSLCVQHFFPPLIMWQAIFNICLNIFCILLWSREQFSEACPRIALPWQWQQRRRAQLSHLAAARARAGAAAAELSRAGLHRAGTRAWSTWSCRQPQPHVRLNVKSSSWHQPAHGGAAHSHPHVGGQRSGNSRREPLASGREGVPAAPGDGL